MGPRTCSNGCAKFLDPKILLGKKEPTPSPWTSLMTSRLGKYSHIQASQMHVQACSSTPKYLPFRDCLPLHPQRRRRLEASYHSQTNSFRNPKAAGGRTEHRKSGTARALNPVQDKQRRVHKKGESFCSGEQKNKLMILIFHFSLSALMGSLCSVLK